MSVIRKPAVSGMFYPDGAEDLQGAVRGYMADAEPPAAPSATIPPKAIIAPHAGYIYSGPVAGQAYGALAPHRDVIHRVVLIGPCHRVAVRGLALPDADAFETPLGTVPLDRTAMDRIAALPQVCTLDATHAQEHSLEVHLPFLQEALGDFTLVPLVAGDATAEEVAAVIEALWDGPETLIVISSDLSHYLDYDTARALDAQTAAAIEALNGDAIGPEQACGRVPVRGLLRLAKKHGLSVHRAGLCTSGDTAGPRDRVVGYGAWLFYQGAPA